MGYPFWVTSNNLGTRTAGFSLTSSPIQLVFGESENLNCTVQLLNGALPTGISYQTSGYQIILKGELPFAGSTQSYTFTFRISNSVFVSDRTFTLNVTETISVFEWVTDNSLPLLYVYDNQIQTAVIRARSVPLQAITYTCTNFNQLSRGITLTSNSGTIQVDMAWKPLTAYSAAKDYVYSNNQLYVCAVSGTSNSTQGPQASGIFVVDTAYAAWQPERLYSLGTVVTHSIGKIYVCTRTGTSSPNANAGPSSTADYIEDGTCVWAYQSQALVWNQIATNTSVTLNMDCVAQAGTSSILRTFNLRLVSREAAPIWLTPAGLLLSVVPGQLFSYQLQVQDPDQAIIEWQSVNLPTWISLSITGELSGQAPAVSQTTAYTFDVSVTDQIHTNSQTFEIRVLQEVSTLAWVTSNNLGIISDGVISYVQVQASTPITGATITYGWRGGMIPQGLRLNNQTGHLEGFVEYHGADKTYYFEIVAQDGVNQITKLFEVTVQSANQGPYWSLSMPIWGDFKSQILSDNTNSVIPDSDLYLLNEPRWGRNALPSITIMSGIQACSAEQLRMMISNYMHEWVMNFNDLEKTHVPELPYGTIDVQVRDAVSPPLWQPSTRYALNARVSVNNGNQYQVTQSGTSGTTSPTWQSATVTDNQITWVLISSPNSSSIRSAPLPWYPYHEYKVLSTVVREGVTYTAMQTGRSGGRWPHVQPGQTVVQDNTVRWEQTTVTTGNNTYWPSCITNMRRVIRSNLPWSNSWGTGALAQLQVVPGTGACVAVNMVLPGKDYYHAPPVRIISSTGSGAQLESYVGILSAAVVESTTGVPDLAQFTVDLGNGAAATLLVDGVDMFGRASRIAVITPGAYTQVPSDPIVVVLGSSVFKIRVNVGVVQVQVTEPGSGYLSTDVVDFTGQEWDPVRHTFIDEYRLNLCLAYIQDNSQTDPVTLANPYKGYQIPVKYVQADLQGITWQGYTRLDADSCTWDSHSTRFVEIRPAHETVWDLNELVWDAYSTTFDRLPVIRYPEISSTVFDQDHTLFDWYSTVFDSLPVTYQSRWKASWVWFMGLHE